MLRHYGTRQAWIKGRRDEILLDPRFRGDDGSEKLSAVLGPLGSNLRSYKTKVVGLLSEVGDDDFEEGVGVIREPPKIKRMLRSYVI